MVTPPESPVDSLGDEEAAKRNIDFLTLVSIVSKAYSQGTFLKFSTLCLPISERELSPFRASSVYTICSRKIKYRLPSTVERGQFEDRDEKVLLKTPGQLFRDDGAALDLDELRGVLTEIQVLSHMPLYLHDNIVRLLGVRWHCEQFAINPAVQPQLVLEAAECTLEDFLVEHEDISFESRVRLNLDMVSGLEALHGCGLIHGDINPRNVFIKCVPKADGRGRLRRYIAQLANFNSSFPDDGVPRRLPGGRSGFFAPEVMKGHEIIDFKATDVYSLGITLRGTNIPSSGLTIPGIDYIPPAHDVEDTQIVTSESDKPMGNSNFPKDLFLSKLSNCALSQLPENRDLMNLKSLIVSYLEANAPDLLAQEASL
jgi:serine/threonine protein kinase